MHIISSNGGVWNQNDKDHNNVIKAFKFKDNEIVTVEYDPINL